MSQGDSLALAAASGDLPDAADTVAAGIPSPRLQRALRLARVGWLFLRGALTVLLVFPWVADRQRQALRQAWSADILSALGIRLEADLAHLQAGSLVVANHISWLDIFVINAAFPAAFVAKAEVRSWPLIGWLAAANDTVFLRRGHRNDARRINEVIGNMLAAGRQVALFPEGTTSDGTRVLPFHAALLQPAVTTACPVTPLGISYWTPAGQRSLAPRYDGEISLGASLGAVLATPRLEARLCLCPALVASTDRRQLAAAAREQILAACGLADQSPPPATDSP